MKKLLFLLMMSLLPMVASAGTTVIDGIYYNLISKGNIAEVAANPNRYSGDVVIPETVTYNEENYTVTAILQNAFENCNLNSIAIPSSIKKIGNKAFWNGTVTSVKITDLAAWCNINFESEAKANPLTNASHLFLNDDEIHDLVIPDEVKTITSNAFYSFRGLTSVKIPSSVTSIGYQCFYGCSGIKTVEIGDNVSQETATIMGGRTFYECNNIDSVVLGNNIVEIGREDFYNCKGIHSIVIPNSVKKMGSHVFLGCENLEFIRLSDNLTKIEWSSFNACTSLKEIVIPDGVELLGDAAFQGCTSLTSVKLPSNLKKIDWSVFQYCTSLTSIEIPDLTHTIYITAFDGCSNLKTVTLGKSMKDIQNAAFAHCPALEKVYCKAKTPPTCYTGRNNVYSMTMDPFYDSYIEHITLHVPVESVNTYKATDPWKNFKEIVAIDGLTDEIPKCEKPTISYANGQLKMSCATEGVEYVTDITDADVKKHYDATISLTATYNISVYAAKAGYENSETVTATLCWIDKEPKSEGITNEVHQIAAHTIIVQSNEGVLSVQGADEGEIISVYNLSGQRVSSAKAGAGITNIITSLHDEVAVIKIGKISLKVLVK